MADPKPSAQPREEDPWIEPNEVIPDQSESSFPDVDNTTPELQSEGAKLSPSAFGEWPADIPEVLKTYLEATFKARPGGPVPASGKHFFPKEVEKTATSDDDNELLSLDIEED